MLSRRLPAWALDLLCRRYTVRVAKTQAEREEIYRFRYRIYVSERNRQAHRHIDTQRGWLRDEDDEAPGTIIVYIRGRGGVLATMRVRCWEQGQIPDKARQHYGVSRLPGLEDLRVCDTGYLMLDPSVRGSLMVLALTIEAGRLAIATHQVQASLTSCAPGLMRPYTRLGYRDFGGGVATSDVMLVPMVFIPSDLHYARQTQALWYPMLTRQSRKGLLSQRDLTGLLQAIQAQQQVTADAASVAAILADPPALGDLTEAQRETLADNALVLDVPEGTRVTSAGVAEREAYLILSGAFAAPGAAPLAPGQSFGVVEHLTDEHRRQQSIYARSSGQLLVIRSSTLRRSEPLRQLLLARAPGSRA